MRGLDPVLRWITLLSVGLAFWGLTLRPAGPDVVTGAPATATIAPVSTAGPVTSPSSRLRARPEPHAAFAADEVLDGMDPTDMDDMLTRCVTLLYRGEVGYAGIVELVRRAEAVGALPEHIFFDDPGLLFGQALQVVTAHGDALLRFGLYLHEQPHDALPHNLRGLRRQLEGGHFGPLLGYVRTNDPELRDGYVDLFAERLSEQPWNRQLVYALSQVPGARATAELSDLYRDTPDQRRTIVSALYLRGDTAALRSLLPDTHHEKLASLIHHALAHPRRSPFPAD